MKIEATDHARCSASAAERWLNCPGSVNLAKSIPSTTSFAAAQGTYAHAIAARCAASGANPSTWLGRKTTVDGHEIECDQEMVDGVQLYLSSMDSLFLGKAWVELSLHDALKGWDQDLGGTADYATCNAKLLRVVDFKYGAGVFVSADDNKQLKTYALGALLAVGRPVETVEVYIVQPRYEGVEPVRMESFPAYDLMDFAGDLAVGAQATRRSDAPLNPGPWCSKTFCPNAAICPALERKQHMLIKQEFGAVTPVDLDKLAEALTAIPLVKERIKAIEELAYAEATAGRKLPGYKLVDKRPRRQWTDEAAVIKWAKERAIDPFEEPSLKSPAQLEKGLKKLEKAELAQFTASVSSGTTLAPESDARQAVSKAITVEDFTAIGGPVKAQIQSPAFNLLD